MISKWCLPFELVLVDQNVNKVSTGVRLIHIPTGTVVQSTVDRTQYEIGRAMKMSQAKLYQMEQKRKLRKLIPLR